MQYRDLAASREKYQVMVRIGIIPYRKIEFARSFGFTVRDLMILRILEDIPDVESIHWFERPDLPHEFARNLVQNLPGVSAKVTIHRRLDLNVVGALIYRRAWAGYSLKKLEPDILRWADNSSDRPILLDFNPFYVPGDELIDRCYYWYDLIDTFTKHNRFTLAEKAAVAIKYRFVQQNAQFVSGVTSAAVAPFNGEVLANRLLAKSIGDAGTSPEYDLGFIGFITDKFDLDAVRKFAEAGLRILICGHGYNPETVKAIQDIPNVTYHGTFSADDVPTLVSQFRVGMVPYRAELSHDESPIKFFQYLAYGRPTILSARFNEIENDFAEAVHYFDLNKVGAVLEFVRVWSSDFPERSKKLRKKTLSHKDIFWDEAIAKILNRFSSMDATH